MISERIVSFDARLFITCFFGQNMINGIIYVGLSVKVKNVVDSGPKRKHHAHLKKAKLSKM